MKKSTWRCPRRQQVPGTSLPTNRFESKGAVEFENTQSRLVCSPGCQANPPFVEEVMERMVDHMHHLLERATGPMSFAVIVPGWNDEGCVSYQNMKKSRFARPQTGEISRFLD